MGSSAKVLVRMDKRVAELSKNLGQYADSFKVDDSFVGPSIYFHYKTLSIRCEHSTAKSLLESDDFFDYLYATLTSWGLHRMGPGNTKLTSIEELKSSFRASSSAIQRLWPLDLTEVDDDDREELIKDVWTILSGLRVSIAQAQIVANSKALHHVLPSLVPPIDRTYTYNFFYNRTGLSISEKDAFSEMYGRFHHIARANKGEIQQRVGQGFNTSETKVIDNAIMGYVLRNL